jgi:hypothetical protein
MATAHDRRAVDRGAGGRPRLSWLGAIGIGLVLALAAAIFVQLRQQALLEHESRRGGDTTVLLVYQAELDYLRLREQWRRAVDMPGAPDAAALRLRYETWVSRVQLLAGQRAERIVPSREEWRATMAQLSGFIAAADPGFGVGEGRVPDRTTLAALAPALEDLGPPLRALSLGAGQRVAALAERRAEGLRQQNRLDLGLTAFLAVLTLAFAFIALRHVRELRARRLALEDLATRLRVAQRDAEAASEAKSAFLANISHEIRTPFHGLMGMLALLRESGLQGRQVEHLRTATESADHLLALLNDVLDMSQLESGRLTLVPAPVDLRALLRDVEALMRPQAHAKHLSLHIDAAPDLPARLQADATRLKQVLFNLLSNAIKYSERGAVVLEVHRRADAQGAPALEFAVTDTGIGMDAATMANLFNRFVQGDGSRTRRHTGTGLGLEISRNLARLMGGDIAVRSRPGEGSCFTFTMPLVELGAPPPPVPTAPATSAPAGALGTPGPRRTLDVLVAEDHPVNRQYLAALLETLGHHAHFTTNGEEAVRAARERRFDIVLMDLHMPVLDGVAATIAIRALPGGNAATLPIVALTADVLPETRERCLVVGMNDFLTKPVSPQKLAATLRRFFGAGAALGVPAEVPVATSSTRAEGAALIDDNVIASALQAMPRETLAAMIDDFLAQGPETVQRLRTAMRDAQPLELRVHAHAAKGVALNLGLPALATTAEALQEGASHLPAHELARLVQRYDELLRSTRAAAEAAGLLRPVVAPVAG